MFLPGVDADPVGKTHKIYHICNYSFTPKWLNVCTVHALCQKDGYCQFFCLYYFLKKEVCEDGNPCHKPSGAFSHAGLRSCFKRTYSAYMHKDWSKFMALIFPETCPASRCCSASAGARGHSD